MTEHNADAPEPTRDQDVGRQIRRIREAIGLSQADLASWLSDMGVKGIYPQTIVKLEQGSRTLKFVEGLKLAEVFGVAPGALVDPDELRDCDVRALRLSRALLVDHSRVLESFGELQTDAAVLAALVGEGQLQPGVRETAERQLLEFGPERTARMVVGMAGGDPSVPEAEDPWGTILSARQRAHDRDTAAEPPH